MTEGFVSRDSEKVRPTNNVDHSEHWVKRSGGHATAFSNGEVVLALVEPEAHVDFVDVSQRCGEEAAFMIQADMRIGTESEILGNESQRLSGPDAGIPGDRNGSERARGGASV